MLDQWKLDFDEVTLGKKVAKVNKNIKEKGILSIDSIRGDLGYSPRVNRDLLTGYSYGEVYDWDLYFENIYMSYFGVKNYCKNNVEIFLDKQFPNGYVSKQLVTPRWQMQFKPFLAQIVLLGYKQGQNILWLSGKYYDKLKKYLDYWFWYCDNDRNGLPVWGSAGHSGMDNQSLRAGTTNTHICEGVDLACYLYRELKAMEVLAQALGKTDDAEAFSKHAVELKDLINDTFWDEEDGYYYDRNERTGELIKYKSASSFAVLWGGVATEERAKIFIEKHILNPDEFWLEYPVASWAKNEEGYYQERKGLECTWMGACWLPINYMLMHGLNYYGYTDEANELAVKNYNMVYGEDEVREYYNSETGIGQGLNPFWGWSTLGFFMPYEQIDNYDPTALNADKLTMLGVDKLNIEW